MNEHDYALRDAAMAEFVDSYFKARPQLLRTRHEECLVEAGFKAAWKPDQTERAEKAEAELARLREQKPVRWHVRGNYFHDGDAAILFASRNPMCGAKVEQLYAAPAPAVAAVPEDYRQALVEIALRCTDHDATDAIDALLQSAPQAPAVPEEWRKVMAELTDDLAIEIDQNYPPERRAYPSEQRKYEGEMEIVNRARALLQSAPQAPAVPDDRVSQDESTLTMAASALVLFRAGESAEYMAKAIEALLQSAPQSGSEPAAHHPV